MATQQTTNLLQNLKSQTSTRKQTFNEVFENINLAYSLETDKDNNITLLICTGGQTQPLSNGALQENTSFTYNYLQFAKEGDTDLSASVLRSTLHAHVKEIFKLIAAKVANGESVLS